MVPFRYFVKSSLAFGSSCLFLLLNVVILVGLLKSLELLKRLAVIRYPCCILLCSCSYFLIDFLTLLNDLPDGVCTTTEFLKLTLSDHFTEDNASNLS